MSEGHASPERIVWRLHLASSPDEVHRLLATDEGRARFWAESAVERNGHIDFEFINGMGMWTISTRSAA